MIQFDEKGYFYLLALIPVMVIIFFGLYLQKKRTQRQFTTPHLLRRLAPDTSEFKPILKFILLVLGLTFLILALVNPKIGTQLQTVKREGVDIVFAIDVSKSMLAEDIAPNRLEKAKRLVSEIINQLASDRIGIIAYAGQAYPQLPITTDYGAAKMFLQSINTNMLSSQGTAIDAAITLASTYYDDTGQTNRILFIVSDGEDHSENSTPDVVELATQNNIRIFTLGVGTTKGAPIPIKSNGIVERFKKDRRGETVITRLNETVLAEIARKGNGEYIDGSNTEKAVAYIKKQLNQIDKTEFESRQFAEYKDQFQWFLGIGFFFLFLDIFLLERKTQWVKNLNLFNENDEE